jgi:hypothetical protein
VKPVSIFAVHRATHASSRKSTCRICKKCEDQLPETIPPSPRCRLCGQVRRCLPDLSTCPRKDAGRDPDPQNEAKLDWVKEIAEASDHTYESRRMAKALGYRWGAARSLMREAGMWVRYRRRYRVTTSRVTGRLTIGRLCVCSCDWWQE